MAEPLPTLIMAPRLRAFMPGTTMLHSCRQAVVGSECRCRTDAVQVAWVRMREISATAASAASGAAAVARLL